MNGVVEAIYQMIRQIMDQKGNSVDGVILSGATALYDVPDGLGLDSLDAAELSALLEYRFGHDPYSAGQFPQTIGEIVSYYSTEHK